jgi:hypothetical protein
MIQAQGNYGPWDCSGAPCTLDTTGAPTTSGATTAFPTDMPTGTYTLTYTSSSTTAISVGTCSDTLGTPTSSEGVVTVPFNHTRVQTTAVQSSFCSLTVNSVPITNIHLRAPTSNTTGDFLTSALQQYAPFMPLRFMDALNGNGRVSPSVDNTNCGTTINCTTTWVWTDGTTGAQGRTFPLGSGVTGTSSGGGLSNGISYDYIIEWANITGKDVWINIPIFATDNFVCRLARLFAYGESGTGDNGSNCSTTAATSGPYSPIVPTGLNATSHVYVEEANELWNYAFNQAEVFYCLANGGPEPGKGKTCPHGVTNPSTVSAILATDLANRSLPWDTTASAPYNRANDVAADLTRRNGTIFKQVFGVRSAQIYTTFNKQAADGATASFPTPGLKFIASGFGGGNIITGGIDRIAIAPYFSIEPSDCTGGNVSACASDLNPEVASGGATYGWVTQSLAVSNALGGYLVAYEGGPDAGTGSATEVNTYNNLGLFQTWTNNFTVMWGPQVGLSHPFNWYLGPDATGWGSKNALHDPGSARWDAMTTLILKPCDVNMDGVCNEEDCQIIMNNIGLSPAWRFQGDLTHAGSVSTADETFFSNNGGTPCPP